MAGLADALFRRFEALVDPTGPVPDRVPPATLGGFFRFFVGQMPGTVARLVMLDSGRQPGALPLEPTRAGGPGPAMGAGGPGPATFRQGMTGSVRGMPAAQDG